jgi:hypothetical protein
MAITYKELKDRLTDLGFEDDDVISDDNYRRIYIDSFNLAGETIYGDVMLTIEGYLLKSEESDELRKITKITDETEDDDNVYVPDILVPLYTLLAAHYAWLDDDITKATIYWNEYDDLKNSLMMNVNRPRNAEIIGGF